MYDSLGLYEMGKKYIALRDSEFRTFAAIAREER